eukprot:sb/3464677/
MIVPCVIPHKTKSLRWSEKHDLDLLSDALLSDTSSNPESSSLSLTPRLIGETWLGDLIYVSSSNTVTILEVSGDRTPDEVTSTVVLLPGVTAISVFETQLPVIHIVSDYNSTYLHTMYTVFQLISLPRYSLVPVYKSDVPVFNITITSDTVLVLTATSVLQISTNGVETASDSTQIVETVRDIEEVWREDAVSSGKLIIQSNGEWLLVEPSAIHKLNSHTELVTIPNETLPFTERFLAVECGSGGRLTAVTNSYLLTLDVGTGEITHQVPHYVPSARGAMISHSGCVTVISAGQCCRFSYPTSETFLLPPDRIIKMNDIMRHVLLSRSFSSLSLDKQALLSHRLTDGLSSVFISENGGLYLLSEHKDLFYRSFEEDPAVWERWVDGVAFEEGYCTEIKDINSTYRSLLSNGLQMERSSIVKQYCSCVDLSRVTDKYTQSLIDIWNP